ncbi:MAG: ABC transporter transmembrane domain-containing protein, partial [Cypionkella sp.]
MRRVTKNVLSSDSSEQHGTGWQTMRRVAPYLWPAGEAWVKRRVVAALSFLLFAKLVSITMPYLYKRAVDALVGTAPDAAGLLGLGAVGITVAYGLARFGSVAFGEMRDWIFVRVGQRALRKLALETFTHIHRLSMRYHITRKTGGLSRVIERGVK